MHHKQYLIVFDRQSKNKIYEHFIYLTAVKKSFFKLANDSAIPMMVPPRDLMLELKNENVSRLNDVNHSIARTNRDIFQRRMHRACRRGQISSIPCICQKTERFRSNRATNTTTNLSRLTTNQNRSLLRLSTNRINSAHPFHQHFCFSTYPDHADF